MATTIHFEETEHLPLTDKLRIGGKLFWEGFKIQAQDESTIGISVCSGLWNGLKYKGDILRGLKTGAIVELSLCALNGVRTVFKNYRKVKRLEKESAKLIRKEEDT